MPSLDRCSAGSEAWEEVAGWEIVVVTPPSLFKQEFDKNSFSVLLCFLLCLRCLLDLEKQPIARVAFHKKSFSVLLCFRLCSRMSRERATKDLTKDSAQPSLYCGSLFGKRTP